MREREAFAELVRTAADCDCRMCKVRVAAVLASYDAVRQERNEARRLAEQWRSHAKLHGAKEWSAFPWEQPQDQARGAGTAHPDAAMAHACAELDARREAERRMNEFLAPCPPGVKWDIAGMEPQTRSASEGPPAPSPARTEEPATIALTARVTQAELPEPERAFDEPGEPHGEEKPRG